LTNTLNTPSILTPSNFADSIYIIKYPPDKVGTLHVGSTDFPVYAGDWLMCWNTDPNVIELGNAICIPELIPFGEARELAKCKQLKGLVLIPTKQGDVMEFHWVK